MSGTLVGYLADRLTGKWIKTPEGWRYIEDALEGHRTMLLILKGGKRLQASLWARVEISETDPTEGA